MRHTRLAIALLLLAGPANRTGAQESDVQQLLGNPDPVIQAQIQKIVDSQVSPDARRNVDVYSEMQRLKTLANNEEVVKQIALWVVNTKGLEEHDLVAGGVFYQLDFPASVPIRVFAPCLDADNRLLRDFAHSWFVSDDKVNAADSTLRPLEPMNYGDYRKYVGWKADHKEDVPAGFIRYIYDRSPGPALLVFAGAYSNSDIAARQQAAREGAEGQRKLTDMNWRDIELAEHIVSNAIWLQKNGFNDRFQAALPEATDELTKLAKHDQWWARLYVAEIMRQHRELRQPDVLKQLSTDSNNLVSEIAKTAR